MAECVDIQDFINRHDDEVLTQYRESPNLLTLLRIYLRKAATQSRDACLMFDKFALDTAVGDQLTILGKALGWPRCHCAGQKRPVFGFECDDDDCGNIEPIGGFCEAEWDCGPEYVEFCFTDDEMYRGFLKARSVTLFSGYSRANVTRASRAVFGPLAVIYDEKPGIIGIATGRRLSGIEISIAHLYEQVLPIPPGHRLEIWQSDGAPFGFGDGWGGFCDGYFPIKIPTP